MMMGTCPSSEGTGSEKVKEDPAGLAAHWSGGEYRECSCRLSREYLSARAEGMRGEEATISRSRVTVGCSSVGGDRKWSGREWK